jgi:hypothetical protein
MRLAGFRESKLRGYGGSQAGAGKLQKTTTIE